MGFRAQALVPPMPELFHPDRLQRLAGLRARGVEPYPSGDPAGREWAAEAAAAVDSRAGDSATVSGRILGRRGYGKLAFLDLYDQSGKIQACLQKDRLPQQDYAILKEINRGDFVRVAGTLGRTKLGEPTLFATSFAILSKALLDPPEKWHGLADMELRARLRYVDLFSNPDVRERFLKRSRLIAAMRTVFKARGYTEVETPVLHPIYGGAAARPFRTHHNTLDMDLFLRIAPELYLKRLLVGGLDRVFEVNRSFRNEGISPRHNPEYTMLEAYQAYADFEDMMELTESLIRHLVQATLGPDRSRLTY
ncbi:MAG: amino acid--tRNA ligase-related protein, partial [Planctomycetota bacterium]